MDEVKAQPTVGRYVKKPVEVEAIQLGWDSWNAVCDFLGDEMVGSGGRAHGVAVRRDGSWYEGTPGDGEWLGLLIPTPQVDHLAVEGSWIIKGAAGAFYPCPAEIFEQAYQPC